MLQLLARARERLSDAIPAFDAGRTHPPSNGPTQWPFDWELSSGRADDVVEMRDPNPGRIRKPGWIGYQSGLRRCAQCVPRRRLLGGETDAPGFRLVQCSLLRFIDRLSGRRLCTTRQGACTRSVWNKIFRCSLRLNCTWRLLFSRHTRLPVIFCL